MRQKFVVDEVEKLAVTLGEQFLPLPAKGLDPPAFWGDLPCPTRSWIGRGPVLPAIRGLQGGREGVAHCLGLLAGLRLLGVEDAQKQNPGQLRHILQGTGAVGPAHDVADGFHKGG